MLRIWTVTLHDKHFTEKVIAEYVVVQGGCLLFYNREKNNPPQYYTINTGFTLRYDILVEAFEQGTWKRVSLVEEVEPEDEISNDQ